MQLPGIGRSTAAAIAAFCFGERAAILDGNVKRVLTRVLAFDGDLAEARAERELWARATDAVAARATSSRYTQGLMDLGATVCLHALAALPAVPGARRLRARRAPARSERYPVKTRRLKRGRRENVWLWLRWRDAGLAGPARRRAASGPACGACRSSTRRRARCARRAGWPGRASAAEPFTHVLTHFDWTCIRALDVPVATLGASARAAARALAGRPLVRARGGAGARPAGAAARACCRATLAERA